MFIIPPHFNSSNNCSKDCRNGSLSRTFTTATLESIANVREIERVLVRIRESLATHKRRSQRVDEYAGH